MGLEVTLTTEPTRVVAMIPSHTETLCAIRACDKLVGVDTYSNFPASVADLPRLGSAFEPNLEALVALEPDLVLVDESSELAGALRRAGIPVYAGTAQTYDEVFEKFTVLGELVNRETEAAVLSGRVEGGVTAISERAAQLEPTSVYYEIDATPYSVGPNSFIGVLLSRAGGENIVTPDLGDFPQLSLKEARDVAGWVRLQSSRGWSVDQIRIALRSEEGITPDAPSSAPSRPVTFRQVAEVWFERKRAGLKNGKHIDQNWNTMATYAVDFHPELTRVFHREVTHLYSCGWGHVWVKTWVPSFFFRVAAVLALKRKLSFPVSRM